MYAVILKFSISLLVSLVIPFASTNSRAQSVETELRAQPLDPLQQNPYPQVTETMPNEAMEIDTLGMDISEQEKQAIIMAMHFGREISSAAEKVNGLPYRRDAHAKATGCVRATFTVNNDIPPHFHHSVFQNPGAEFKAWIRFSNGDMTVRADNKPDARGMAIRIMAVPGEKIAPELPASNVQDFVMTNMQIFFHHNVFDYVDVMQYLAKLERTRWFISLWPPRIHPRRLYIAKQTVSSRIKTPLQPQYYSMTPYRLGETALKFSAKPCANMTFTEAANTDDYDYLTKTMQAKLNNNAACFDFMLQEQKADSNMPLDDATVEWSEKESPFIPVAKIKLPAQQFTSLEQQTFCENLSMNPWHGVGEWEPLGSLNRSRRLVYHAVSKYRHNQNDAAVSNPSSWCLDGKSNCDLSEVFRPENN